MVESRWHRRAGPVLLSLAVLGLAASVSSGAEETPWVPSACDDARSLRAIAAGRILEDPSDVAGTPWYRLDPRLDDSASLVGQRLIVGRAGDRVTRSVELEPESFAAGPFGDLVLAGSDDGTTSGLRAIDVAGDCVRRIADERDVIRRATINPSGDHLFEVRVDRRTRADLGVWRRDLRADGRATRVLGPLEPDERFGRTFSTELSWSQDGRWLAIQACGEIACRTRVFDPATGRTSLVADASLGELVGVAGSLLVSYADCVGMPCPIVATDVRTAARTVLSDAAGLAVLVRTDGGPRLVHESFADAEEVIRVVDLRGRAVRVLDRGPGDLRVVPAPPRAQAGMAVPGGWFILAPGGRPPVDGTARHAVLRRIDDGKTVEFGKVLR
jgi:hypothetical protein